MDLNLCFKYTVYKTTNKINGKVYVGFHKTTDPNDDYLGSGKIFKRALKKYGKENFIKEVLFVFNTAEEMFSKEAEIVDKLFVESENTYNIMEGGCGGFDFINRTKKNLYGNNGKPNFGGDNLMDGQKTKNLLMERGMWEDWKKKVSERAKESYKVHGFHWLGKKHKESTKKKIGKKLSIVQKGKGNSQYGTCWIYNDSLNINKKINKEHLNKFLLEGWKKGRKMNFCMVGV